MPIPKRIINNHNIAVKNCKHGIFTYLVNDLFVGKSLDLYGEWTEGEIDILSNFIEPGMVIIDAGAFIGTHTIPFAEMTGDTGLVFAFEPQRMIHNILTGNIAINNLLNVRVINAGLSDTKSMAFMPVLDPSHEQNFGAIGINKFTNGEVVPVMTIDELNLKKLNLIKIDVEGLEAKVLKGGTATIKKYKPVLYLENNRSETSEETIRIVKKMGYEAYWHILPYFNPENFFGSSKNVFADYSPEANMLCLPKGSKMTLKGLVPINGVKDTWESAYTRISKKK